MSYLNLQFVTQSLRNADGPARRCLLGLFNVKTCTVPPLTEGMRGGEALPAPERPPAGSGPAEERGTAASHGAGPRLPRTEQSRGARPRSALLRASRRDRRLQPTKKIWKSQQSRRRSILTDR